MIFKASSYGTQQLGAGKSISVVLSSICLVLIIFFYFFAIGTALEAKIYTFTNRVTYQSAFALHVMPQNIDLLIIVLATIAWCYLSLKHLYLKYGIIALYSSFLILAILNSISAALAGAILSIPIITILILIDRSRKGGIVNHHLQLSLTYLAVISIGLAVSGATFLMVYLVSGGSTVTIDKYPYAIFQELLGIITPVIMAILVFCTPIKVILDHLIEKLTLKVDRISIDITPGQLRSKSIAIYLSLAIMLGTSISLIPHLSTVNPNSEYIGVDSQAYVNWLDQMKKSNINPFYFVFTNSGDRPLSLVVLYLISESVKTDPFQVLEYTPTFLTPLLVAITFLLTRELTANDKISIIAAFLSAISFQTLVGIYSGFYANWIALILGYLVFALIIKYLKSSSKFYLVALAVALIGVLLAHVYTWGIVISIAFVFLIVLHIMHYYSRKQFILLYLVLASSVAVDIVRSFLIGSPSGLEADASVGLSHGLGMAQFTERFNTLADFVQTYYGGAYASFIILGLAFYWLIRSKSKQIANIFVMIFLSSSLIPLFLGDWVLQSRVVYNIPFQIPASISLYWIWERGYRLVFIAIVLIAFYVSFHFIANLGFIPPTNPLSILYE